MKVGEKLGFYGIFEPNKEIRPGSKMWNENQMWFWATTAIDIFN